MAGVVQDVPQPTRAGLVDGRPGCRSGLAGVRLAGVIAAIRPARRAARLPLLAAIAAD